MVFAHISPGKFERYYQPEEEGGGFGFHWFREEYNERYLEIMDEYSDVVSGQVNKVSKGFASKQLGEKQRFPTYTRTIGSKTTPHFGRVYKKLNSKVQICYVYVKGT